MHKRKLLVAAVFLLIFSFLLFWQRPFCQEDCFGDKYFRLKETGKFQHPGISESSGLCQDGNGHFLTHNDDTDSCIYRTGIHGEDLGKECIPVRNTDWEEICRAPNGRIFLGDFGNNLNRRKDLSILILDPSSGLTGKIRFAYEDQNAWPPVNPFRMDFDCEAMVFDRDSLWLFTKNKDRNSASVYVLPARPGSCLARKCGEIKLQGTVTAAALRPDGKELVLLVYRKIYFFSLANGIRQLASPDICLNAPLIRQSEAICYMSKDSLLLSNEQGQLFLIDRR